MNVELDPIIGAGAVVPCKIQPTSSGPHMIPTYWIDRASRMVCLEYQGHPTFQVWAAVMDVIFTDRAFTRGIHFLFDQRSVESGPDIAYVEAVAQFYHHYKKQMGRWAIVVKGLLPFGMGRMTSSLCGPEYNVHVFTNMLEAKEWLRCS